MRTYRPSPAEAVPLLTEKIAENNVLRGLHEIGVDSFTPQPTTAIHFSDTTGERFQPEPFIYATKSPEAAIFYILFQHIRIARLNRAAGVRIGQQCPANEAPVCDYFLSRRGKEFAAGLAGDIGAVYYMDEGPFTYDSDECEFTTAAIVRPVGQVAITAACLSTVFGLTALRAPNDDPAIKAYLDMSDAPAETPPLPRI